VPVGPMPMFLRQIRERLAEKLAAGARASQPLSS
jgi:hypothetical protein